MDAGRLHVFAVEVATHLPGALLWAVLTSPASPPGGFGGLATWRLWGPMAVEVEPAPQAASAAVTAAPAPAAMNSASG